MDVLLLEDEVNTREFFTMLLHSIPEVTNVMSTSEGKEAIQLARLHQPDLILLDIELINDDLTGLEVAQQIYSFDREAVLVFVTAHPQYALSSFAVHPYNYILKPIVIEEFKAIIKEVADNIKSHNKVNAPTLVVPAKRKKDFILKEDIIYIEAEGKQTIINAKAGQWITNQPLKELGHQLNSDFVRVHRSFIVNTKQIKSIIHLSDRTYEIELGDDWPKIPMSRSGYSKYKRLLS